MNTFYSSARFFRSAISLFLLCIAQFTATPQAHAADAVNVDDAWVRSTLAGQDVSAAYMTLTSQRDTQLIRVESDVTQSVEIHSMTMQNGVMKMRMLKELPLTAGKPYKLAPGGYHLMLFDLKKPLTAADRVNFVLTFKSGSQQYKQTLSVNVKSDEDAAEDDHGHHHHHH